MLGASAREHAADLADQRALHPEAAGLVEKVTHLSTHVAKACGRPKDDGVVVCKVVHGRDWCALVQLHARSLGDLLRHQLGNALDRDLTTRYRKSPFGDRLGHLLDVAIGAVVEYENLRHRRISSGGDPCAARWWSWRWTRNRSRQRHMVSTSDNSKRSLGCLPQEATPHAMRSGMRTSWE